MLAAYSNFYILRFEQLFFPEEHEKAHATAHLQQKTKPELP